MPEQEHIGFKQFCSAIFASRTYDENNPAFSGTKWLLGARLCMAHAEVLEKYTNNSVPHILVTRMEKYATRDKILEWGTILLKCFDTINGKHLPMQTSAATIEIQHSNMLYDIQRRVIALESTSEKNQQTFAKMVPVIEESCESYTRIEDKIDCLTILIKDHIIPALKRKRDYNIIETVCDQPPSQLQQHDLVQTTLDEVVQITLDVHVRNGNS